MLFLGIKYILPKEETRIDENEDIEMGIDPEIPSMYFWVYPEFPKENSKYKDLNEKETTVSSHVL